MYPRLGYNSLVVTEVRLSRKAVRDLRRVPGYIVDKLESWVDAVERIGLEKVRKTFGPGTTTMPYPTGASTDASWWARTGCTGQIKAKWTNGLPPTLGAGMMTLVRGESRRMQPAKNDQGRFLSPVRLPLSPPRQPLSSYCQTQWRFQWQFGLKLSTET